MQISRALAAIATERNRQIEVLGWTPEHDLEHSVGELSDAAACYAASSGTLKVGIWWLWPWGATWKDAITEEQRLRQLEKAGACIVAEMERLYRVQERELLGHEGNGKK